MLHEPLSSKEDVSGTIYLGEDASPNSSSGIAEPQNIEEFIEHAKNEIFVVKGIFPFSLIPGVVRIFENRIELGYRFFGSYRRSSSFLIKDLVQVDVVSHTKILNMFVKMNFTLIGNMADPNPVNHLPIKKASRAQTIINGLITATKMNLDISDFPKPELLEKLEELGKLRV